MGDMHSVHHINTLVKVDPYYLHMKINGKNVSMEVKEL